MKKCFALLMIFLLHSSCASARNDYSGEIVPEIRLERSKYVLGDSIRFWVGAKTKDGSPIAWPEHTLYITRPNGTVKTIHLQPAPDGMSESSSFLGGAGLGEEPQLGKYLLVFEILDQKTAPVELHVEEVDIFNSIKADFIFGGSKKYSIDEKIPFELRVANNSNEIIRFKAPGFIDSPLDIFFQNEKGGRAAVPYPADKLMDDQFKNGDYLSHSDSYNWKTAKFMPTITLNPGEVYKKSLWLNDVYQFFSPSPGKYTLTLSTVLTILIGEEGGKYNDFCPGRIPVKSVIGLEIGEHE